jgi:NAD(P)-dependent dehydrogenase (short-subunit alcohol dehydrogenase family)
MSRLSNKVALITGGNSGIGYATAEAFIKEGATVIITGRSAQSVAEAVEKLGPQAKGIVSDTAKMEDIRQIADAVSAISSQLDVIFINAGIAKFVPFEHMTEAVFDETFDINVKGAYFTIQKLLPLLKDGSSIVLNTSINAHIGMEGASVYAASKAAMITFARNLSRELLPRQIRVNAISPGPVATPILSKAGMPEEVLQHVAAGIQSQIPLGRFGTSDEIAKIAVFFASDDSAFVLGAELIADGGMSTL